MSAVKRFLPSGLRWAQDLASRHERIKNSHKCLLIPSLRARIPVMKSHYVTVTATALLLAACSQPEPEVNTGRAQANVLPREAARSHQYIALPGQSARAVTPTDTDAAFEQQAAAYAAASQPFVPAPGTVDEPGDPSGQAQPVVVTAPQQQAGIPPTVTPLTSQPTPEPPLLQNPEPSAPVPSSGQASSSLPQTQAAASANPGKPAADYAVQVNNGTNGRLYIDVYDESDNIFPIAFMYAGQTISTPPQEARPIKGKLTVVIRDPDRPGAPEIRRYKVDPPASYQGKTVGITILPGGQYRASLDGEVYYSSPLPVRPGQSNETGSN